MCSQWDVKQEPIWPEGLQTVRVKVYALEFHVIEN